MVKRWRSSVWTIGSKAVNVTPSQVRRHMISRRPIYWANEPWEGLDNGRLLPFVCLFIAVPTYLFVRLLARTVPDYHAIQPVISGDVVGVCPTPQNDGQCGECRSCWDRSIANVAYTRH